VLGGPNFGSLPPNNFEQLYTMLQLMVFRGYLLPNNKRLWEGPGFRILRRLNKIFDFQAIFPIG
jgi:hypothetical protein